MRGQARSNSTMDASRQAIFHALNVLGVSCHSDEALSVSLPSSPSIVAKCTCSKPVPDNEMSNICPVRLPWPFSNMVWAQLSPKASAKPRILMPWILPQISGRRGGDTDQTPASRAGAPTFSPRQRPLRYGTSSGNQPSQTKCCKT